MSIELHDPDHAGILLRGIVGAGSTALGVVTSFQEQLEWWLRVTSLGLGILVAIVTLHSLLKGYRKP